MKVCCAFVILAFIHLAFVPKPRAFREEIFTIVVDRAFDGYAFILAADMWAISVHTVNGIRTIDRFAFVVFANFLIAAIVDALAFRFETGIWESYVFVNWIVARANLVWFAVKRFHACNRLASLISAAAFALFAIFFRVVQTVLVLFAIRIHAIVVFAKSLFSTVIIRPAFLDLAYVPHAKTVSILAAADLLAHEISSTLDIVALAFRFVAQLMIAAVLVILAFLF